MKYPHYFVILAFVLGITMAACRSGNSGSSTIGPGNWTIKDPTRYDFPCKRMQAFEFCPTLTLGSNGSMLYVQLFGDSTRPALPKGVQLHARVLIGNDSLKVLERPVADTLEKVNGSPFATWYFEPPRQGQTASSITLAYNGNTISWVFSEAKKLNP